jgi:uncharacterized protein YegL
VSLQIDAAVLPGCMVSGDVVPIYAVLVIDRSGSMAGAPLAEARNAAADFADLMDLALESDAIAVVTFNDSASLRQPFSQDRGQVVRAILGIFEEGETDIAAGLNLAIEQFQTYPLPANARRLIILLSDGQSDPPAAIAAASQAKSQNIQIVTIALGDADRSTLAQLASTEADYYETTDPTALIEIYSEIAEGLVGTIATNVELVENFNHEDFSLSGGLVRGQQNDNQINWQLPFVGRRGRSVGYFLQPRKLGRYLVSEDSGQISLLDCNGQFVSQATINGPDVWVLPPVWLFYIAPVLALIWLIYRIIQALRSPPPKPVSRPKSRQGLSVSPAQRGQTEEGMSHGRRRRPTSRE